MPRQWTPHALLPGQTVRAKTLNALARGLQQSVDEINGDQIPPASVPVGGLVPLDGTRGTVSAFRSALNEWRSWAMYDDNQKIIYPPGQGSDWTDLIIGVSTRPGLTFDPGPAGGVFGELILDSELRPTTRPGATVLPRGTNTIFPNGSTPWREFGVFVDGRLVATTHRLYQGRETVTVSWFTPSAGGAARVEIKVRANLGFLQGTSLNIRPLVVNGLQLWACRPLA